MFDRRAGWAFAVLGVILGVGAERVAAQSWLAAEDLAAAREHYYAQELVEAEAQLRAVLEADPGRSDARFALVHVLLERFALDEARQVAAGGLEAAPEEALVHAAQAEVHFADGKFGDAATSLLRGRELDASCARVLWNLGRLFEIDRFLRSARQYYQQAYEADPNDPEIVRDSARSHPEPEVALERLLQRYGLEATAVLEGTESTVSQAAIVSTALGLDTGYHCRLKKRPPRAVLPLRRRPVAGRSAGHMLAVRANGAKETKLVLDSGASGLTIEAGYAEKAGVVLLTGEVQSIGIGREGPRQFRVGVVESLRVGKLEFENCLVQVGKALGGIVGLDLFYDDFVVTLSFREPELRLAAYDEQLEDPWSYDRNLKARGAGFYPIRFFGNDPMVPARLNGELETYLLIDTGASTTVLDLQAASQVTDVSRSFVEMKGLSGRVEEVWQAREVVLELAGLRQRHDEMIVIDLDSIHRAQGHYFGGLLGYSFLSHNRMVLDYRNGLLRFDPQ